MAEKVKIVRETATPDLHKAVMNISDEVTDLRDTVKLAIAFERTTPWHEVSESEVDAYLKLLRELKVVAEKRRKRDEKFDREWEKKQVLWQEIERRLQLIHALCGHISTDDLDKYELVRKKG